MLVDILVTVALLVIFLVLVFPIVCIFKLLLSRRGVREKYRALEMGRLSEYREYGESSAVLDEEDE